MFLSTFLCFHVLIKFSAKIGEASLPNKNALNLHNISTNLKQTAYFR